MAKKIFLFEDYNYEVEQQDIPVGIIVENGEEVKVVLKPDTELYSVVSNCSETTF